MSRTPLPSPTPGCWAGLRLEVGGPARPGLRVEVTGGRRLLVRQAEHVVLLGRQRAAHRGVQYIRTNGFHSPLPPIEAALARHLRQTSATTTNSPPTDAELSDRLGQASGSAGPPSFDATPDDRLRRAQGSTSRPTESASRLRPADGSASPSPASGALADRVQHAREDGRADRHDAAWAARWTHRFADWLQVTDSGPLHTGSWTLAWGMPSWSVAAHWSRLAAVDPDRGHITWFGYGDPEDDQRDILPLRRLAGPDAARVGSYRRQVREGILPPVLLWWVSGLNVLLVLDGHDRISAALAEGDTPEVIVLAPAPDPVGEAAGHEHLLRDTRGSLAPGYAEQVARIARTEGRTRAWPLPGGAPAWDREVVAGDDA